VATGMLLAARLSAQLGWIDPADVERIRLLLEQARLPVSPPDSMTTQQFLDLMAVDKKVLDGGLRLVLMKGIGQSIVTGDFSMDALRQTLDEALA